MTPIDYLTDWRIAKAGAALREGKSIASVAESIGYSSEAAFNSAFKRIVEQSPGRYRQSQFAACGMRYAAGNNKPRSDCIIVRSARMVAFGSREYPMKVKSPRCQRPSGARLS